MMDFEQAIWFVTLVQNDSIYLSLVKKATTMSFEGNDCFDIGRLNVIQDMIA